MSATTAPHKERRHHAIIHHATRPYGLFAIGALIFLAAWMSWNFWLAASVAH